MQAATHVAFTRQSPTHLNVYKVPVSGHQSVDTDRPSYYTEWNVDDRTAITLYRESQSAAAGRSTRSTHTRYDIRPPPDTRCPDKCPPDTCLLRYLCLNSPELFFLWVRSVIYFVLVAVSFPNCSVYQLRHKYPSCFTHTPGGGMSVETMSGASRSITLHRHRSLDGLISLNSQV